MVEHIIEQTAQKVKENQNLQNTDYLDAEGLCWCGICGERKENRYKVLGHERILPCLCRCDREKLEAQKEEERKQDFAIKVSNLKSVGLTEPRFREWRFENDNGSTPKLDIARQYVENWKDMQQRNIGYVLMGPVGTGKSFFAGCVANRLMEQGIPVMMTNFSRILNTLTGIYSDDRNQFIDSFNKYSLLIIDDLGIERSSEFALEQVFNVIDSRYRSKKPLIVTTNLTLDELKHPKDLARARIYDRVLERCVPLKINNQNIRELNAAANMQEARKILNSGT